MFFYRVDAGVEPILVSRKADFGPAIQHPNKLRLQPIDILNTDEGKTTMLLAGEC